MLNVECRDKRAMAAVVAEEEVVVVAVVEAAVVASIATTITRITGNRLLTISSQEHLRRKQALTAKLTHMQPVSANP